MKATFVSSKDNEIEKCLATLLAKSSKFDWAVAFGSHSAFKLLESDFLSFFRNGGRSRAVFDLSAGFTDPQLIEELLTIPGDSFCKVFTGASEESI